MEAAGEVQTITIIGPDPVQFEPISGSSMTKGTSVQDGSALLFGWAVGDTLGIFPNYGNQVEFPISAALGSTSASFDGGGWALRNNAAYAAYYPFSVWNYHLNNETILLDYSGQVQKGNGSFAHLSAYDYLASNKTTPVNSSVTFQMERQGAILYIDIVVPEPETITALTLSCDEAIFVEMATLDISGDTPVVKPLETKTSLTLSFDNTETTANNEIVRAYMAIQPLDFSDKNVTATLYTKTGNYSAPVTPRVVNKGRAAFLRFSDDFTPVNIEFADPEVKRICVENWDTNGDGELSYKEAAAVTDLGNAFSRNSSISSFNELEYFTGLTEIANNAFKYCYSLESVVLPECITRIGHSAFYGCHMCVIVIPENVTSVDDYAFVWNSNLTSFQGKFASSDGRCLIIDGILKGFAPKDLTYYIIPSGVTHIGNEVFAGNSFTHIVLPNSLTHIGFCAFRACRFLTSIEIPGNVTSIDFEAFTNCERLFEFRGKFASPDGRCLIKDGYLLSFAPYGLASYTIPEGVTCIGNQAFVNCTELTSILLPEGITSLDIAAFTGCENLASVVLPKSLTTIRSEVFRSCYSLTSVVISENITDIESHAFWGCRSLASIECKAIIPPRGFADMFELTNNCPIYVPNESVEAYKTSSGWINYAERIFGIDVEGSVVGPGPQNPD